MSKVAMSRNGSDGILSKDLEKSLLWRIKTRLQFSGWLQYIPNAMMALLFFLLSGVGWLMGVAQVYLFWLPFSIGSILLALFLFDLVTVKMGLRPEEAIPKPASDKSDEFEAAGVPVRSSK